MKLCTNSKMKKKFFWGRYGLLPRMSRLEWAYCTISWSLILFPTITIIRSMQDCHLKKTLSFSKSYVFMYHKNFDYFYTLVLLDHSYFIMPFFYSFFKCFTSWMLGDFVWSKLCPDSFFPSTLLFEHNILKHSSSSSSDLFSSSLSCSNAFLSSFWLNRLEIFPFTRMETLM